jgi:hypothetical protein
MAASADEPPTKTKESMRIKVNIQNNSAINAELLKVNGRAESFTITCAKQILEAINGAERKMSAIPKAKWKGAKVMFRPAGPSANSYKYNAKSTRVYIERGATDWFLVNIQPDAVSPKEKEFLRITISADQAAEIQRRAIADFSVQLQTQAA